MTVPEIAGSDFGRVAGGANRIAVVDCETTGIYNSDRIVEIAIVTLDLSGQTIESWDTLVQPQRDVTASWIHGLTAASVRDAPTFSDIAGDVALRLDGSCVAAHNLPFDLRMLSNEFNRLGAELAVLSGIDTLTATSCRLSVACDRYAVPLSGAHTALADATATAALLSIVAPLCSAGSPAAAPIQLVRCGRVLRRTDSRPTDLPDPPHLAALLASLDYAGVEASMLAYLEVVDRALADLHLEAQEREELDQIAAGLGLDQARRAQAHRRFVNGLIDVALADGVVTDEELDMCLRVASALSIDTRIVAQRTARTRERVVAVQLVRAMSVVFTGDDPDRAREHLTAHAHRLGLVVQPNVTKQTSLVVAYDIESNSGKAVRARDYGIPLTSTAAFERAQIGDLLESHATSGGRKVITCPDCLATWTAEIRTSRHANQRCEECAAVAAGSAAPSAQGPEAHVRTPIVSPDHETLRCMRCGQTWLRVRCRGRKPHRCPECTGAVAEN